MLSNEKDYIILSGNVYEIVGEIPFCSYKSEPVAHIVNGQIQYVDKEDKESAE